MPSEAEKINDTLTSLRIDIAEVKTMLIEVKEKNKDYETRIRALEQARWRLAGVASVLGTMGGAGVSWVVNALNGGG